MKNCLIVEGGGMKCVFGAGVLNRFLDEHITVDEVHGVSAGAANAASFLATDSAEEPSDFSSPI